MKTIAYLALGSNLGNREEYLKRAGRELSRSGLRLVRASTIIETEPWGVTDQPRFLNQVIEVAWERGPLALLSTIKTVETQVGRVATVRWGPREIDIDLLLFNDLVVFEPQLQIPHPRMWD